MKKKENRKKQKEQKKSKKKTMEKNSLKKMLMNIDNNIFMEKINPYECEKMLIRKLNDKNIKDF